MVANPVVHLWSPLTWDKKSLNPLQSNSIPNPFKTYKSQSLQSNSNLLKPTHRQESSVKIPRLRSLKPQFQIMLKKKTT